MPEKTFDFVTVGSPLHDAAALRRALEPYLAALASLGVDGAALAGDGGTGTEAPGSFTAAVTGTTATLTWAAVSGVDHYELREAQSPTGVTGQTALTGTTVRIIATKNTT